MFKTVIATALIATAVTPALANDHAWQVGNDAMHIYYSDIDLNSAAGRAQLLARVQRAADKLCRDRVDQRGCVADTVAQAARLPGGAPLQLALGERNAVKLAAK